MDNERRASQALVAARDHIADAGGSVEDGIIDLASNLLHVCDRVGVDVEQFLSRVAMHHDAEVLEEAQDSETGRELYWTVDTIHSVAIPDDYPTDPDQAYERMVCDGLEVHASAYDDETSQVWIETGTVSPVETKR